MSESVTESVGVDVGEDRQTNLALGDFIQISAPGNDIIDGKTFFINYISSTEVELLDIESGALVPVRVRDDGSLSDETIEAITIVARAKEQGFARQNGLLPGVWIDIRFGGDVVSAITGQITDLEKDTDMIEIQPYPSGDKIYIDFGYMGMPRDLNIESITIRDIPEKALRDMAEKSKEAMLAEREALDRPIVREERDERDEREGVEGEMREDERDYGEREEEIAMDGDADTEAVGDAAAAAAIPDHPRVSKRRAFAIEKELADGFDFGEILGTVEREVKIPESKRIYGIDMQLSDILDEILAGIPTSERTPSVMRRIHTMVQRYRELREKYSVRGEDGFIDGAAKRGSDYRPLVERLSSLDTSVPWVIPVVKNRLRTYDIDAPLSDAPDDVVPTTLKVARTQENEILSQYKGRSVPDGQLGYTYLTREMSALYTPTADPDTIDDVIRTAPVQTAVDTVTDNHGDLASTTVKGVNYTSRKYVARPAIVGETILRTGVESGNRFIRREPIGANDRVHIKSYITMPYPYVEYSRTAVPGTTIYQKANIHQVPVQKWEVLNQRESVQPRATSIRKEGVVDAEENIEAMMVRTMNHVPIADELIEAREAIISTEQEAQMFSHYLSAIIPRTRPLFEALKDRIPRAVNMSRVVQWMAPFYVEHDTLTFKQYEAMLQYIQTEIDRLKADIEVNNRKALKLRTLETKTVPTSDLVKLFDDKDNIYALYQADGKPVLRDEAYAKMLRADFAHYFNESVAVSQSAVSAMKDEEEVLQDVIGALKTQQSIERTESRMESGSCYEYVLVKKYRKMDELNADNGSEAVYVDKEYDLLAYPDIQRKREVLKPAQFLSYLSGVLLSGGEATTETEAEVLAKEIIAGRRAVQPGQYAVVYGDLDVVDTGVDTDLPSLHRYFRRTADNMWVEDTDLSERIATNKQTQFCNLQERCLRLKGDASSDSQCAPTELNRTSIIVQDLQKMLKSMKDEQFFDRDRTGISPITQEKARIRLARLTYLLDRELSRVSRIKYLLGLTAADPQGSLSPYADLRDRILGIQELLPRVEYLKLFINRFTRAADPTSETEDDNWLYCVKTSTQLLPSFFTQIVAAVSSGASGTLLNPVYANICKKRGQISDDGDKWVDKYSGYTIRMIDYSEEDGFDEAGNLASSHEILEEESTEAALREVAEAKEDDVATKPPRFTTPDERLALSVVAAVALNMGIRLDAQYEFIVGGATREIKKFYSKATYQKYLDAPTNRGKKLPPYEEARNIQFMRLILAMTHLAIQTSIPSIKTKKSFPGCKKSFDGFPVYGTTTDAGMEYVACVAMSIAAETKSDKSAPPHWLAIKRYGKDIARLKDDIRKRIDDLLVSDPTIKSRVDEKQAYIADNLDNDVIPDEVSVGRWKTFLPPMVAPKVETIKNVTSDFVTELEKALKRGDRLQDDAMLLMKGLATRYGMLLQGQIQAVVDKNTVLLEGLNGEKYQQNACCEEMGTMNVKEYLEKENADIGETRRDIERLEEIQRKVMRLSKAGILFHPLNSREALPALRTEYGDETIYSAFLKFCQFNRNIVLNEDVQRMCGNRTVAGLEDTASLEEKIKALKDDGREYSALELERLLVAVSRPTMIRIRDISQMLENQGGISTEVEDGEGGGSGGSGEEEQKQSEGGDDESQAMAGPIQMRRPVVSPQQKILMADPCKGFFSTLTTIGITEATTNKYVRRLYGDFIRARSTDDLIDIAGAISAESRTRLIDFIREHKGLTRGQATKLKNSLEGIHKFSELYADGYDSAEAVTANRVALYLEECIQQITRSVPNIIIEGATFADRPVPKYWKLAPSHMRNIELYVRKSFEMIQMFIGKDEYKSLVEPVMELLKPVATLSRSVQTTEFTDLAEGVAVAQRTTRSPTISIRARIDILVSLLLMSMTAYLDVINTQFVSNRTAAAYGSAAQSPGEEAVPDDAVEDAILSGQIANASKLISTFLVQMMNLFEYQKDIFNYNEEALKDLMLRTAEKEKTEKTDRLTALTEEERFVDTIMKKNKLGVWNVGLQRGLTQYEADTFQAEKAALEQRARMDLRLGALDPVTRLNADIIGMEMIDEQMRGDEIDAEEYDMSGLPDDDDYGDRDGDM